MSRRLTALVVGNENYADAGKLKNPGNDATDIAAKLTECGFTVATHRTARTGKWIRRSTLLFSWSGDNR